MVCVAEMRRSLGRERGKERGQSLLLNSKVWATAQIGVGHSTQLTTAQNSLAWVALATALNSFGPKYMSTHPKI